MEEKILGVLKNIFKESKPVSIFLYGSRARNDFKIDSDYEIGIIYDRNRLSRSELSKKYDLDNLNLYSFELKQFKNYEIDTPFPKSIYLKELIDTGKTILGEDILKNLKSPKIRIMDLIESTSFETATAFAAVRSFRTGDLISTAINFKSCLFGTRVLEILRLKKFVYTYDEIFKVSQELELDDEYRELLEAAMKIRNKGEIEEKYLFKNISFLNQVVMKEVKADYEKDGDKIVL